MTSKANPRPPTILSSPLLNLNVIEKALASAKDPAERVPLLSAKVHLLSNPSEHSQTEPGPSRHADDQALLEARLDLTRAQMAVRPPQLVEAEVHLSLIERTTGNIVKRLVRKRSRERETTPSSPEEKVLAQGMRAAVSVTVNDGQASMDNDERHLNDMVALRREAIELLVIVEEGLGRTGRGQRWRDALAKLQHTPNS